MGQQPVCSQPLLDGSLLWAALSHPSSGHSSLMGFPHLSVWRAQKTETVPTLQSSGLELPTSCAVMPGLGGVQRRTEALECWVNTDGGCL